jgi:hypothetical protein
VDLDLPDDFIVDGPDPLVNGTGQGELGPCLGQQRMVDLIERLIDRREGNTEVMR